MRLWVSQHGLEGRELENLRLIVEYIVVIYVPMWFEIKVKHSCVHGPDHVLKQLQLLRLQKKKVQRLVEKHVKRSAWYSHSEAVLQTLLCSSDAAERAFAVDQILRLRDGRELGDISCRQRVHEKTFNYQATRRQDLCRWDSNVHEPVMACSLTTHQLQTLVDEPMNIPYRPVHGQSMERCVKQVTRACASVFGSAARDGFVRAGVAHRQMVPKNRTKKDLTAMILE